MVKEKETMTKTEPPIYSTDVIEAIKRTSALLRQDGARGLFGTDYVMLVSRAESAIAAIGEWHSADSSLEGTAKSIPCESEAPTNHSEDNLDMVEPSEISVAEDGWFIPCDCMSSIAENTFCEMISVIKRGGAVDVLARCDGKDYRWQCDGLKYAKYIRQPEPVSSGEICYTVRRDDSGYAAAIEKNGYTVLQLCVGTTRNEEEIEALISSLNSSTTKPVSSYRMVDGRPIFGEGSPHDIGEHLDALVKDQPDECRVKTIDREYAERMAASDDYQSISQSHIHSLAKLALFYMKKMEAACKN